MFRGLYLKKFSRFYLFTTNKENGVSLRSTIVSIFFCCLTWSTSAVANSNEPYLKDLYLLGTWHIQSWQANGDKYSGYLSVTHKLSENRYEGEMFAVNLSDGGWALQKMAISTNRATVKLNGHILKQGSCNGNDNWAADQFTLTYEGGQMVGAGSDSAGRQSDAIVFAR